jgi:hypothetical protein
MVVGDLISCDLEGGVELDYVGVCFFGIRASYELVAGAIEKDEDLFDVGAGWEVGRLGDLAGDGRYRRFWSGRHRLILAIEMVKP